MNAGISNMVISLKQHGFRNEYEYAKWLANRLGFAKYKDYLNHLATRRGYRNRAERQRQAEIKNGFPRAIDYKNHLARQRGFKDFYEYKKSLKKSEAKKISISEVKDDDWMYKPILNINTHTNYDGNKINHEWMD